MRNQNLGGNGSYTRDVFPNEGARHHVPQPLLEGRRTFNQLTPSSVRQPMASRHIGKAWRVNWQVILLWTFIAVSFASFLFAGYLIWVKCQGSSPI